MKDILMPALLWILHCEDKDLAHLHEITRTDITDGASNDFHDEGLFSTSIFGLVGSEERDENYAKIDLRVRVLHPKIYRDLTQLKTLYKDILDGSRTAVFDETIKDFVASTEESAETGYSFFMRHLSRIEFQRNKSPARNKRIDFIQRWMHRATMKNLLVMPAGFRDVEVGDDGQTTKHEINDFYYRALSITRSTVLSGDMESPIYDQIRRSLGNTVNGLYAYLEGIVGGKTGFLKDKWASRRVREGTRNVLTSMNTSGRNLASPNVPGFDTAVIGVYQAAVSLAPLVIHWLRTGTLSKIMTAGEGDVPLVDSETLETKWVSLTPYSRDRWTTEDGLRKLIHSLVDTDARNRPVEIEGSYLALVYLGKDSFRVFDSITELPPELSRDDAHPITLIELIYLAGYSKWSNYFGTITRYPVTNDDSTYQARIYVKTTSSGDIRRELDVDWVQIPGDEGLAVEYPRLDLTTYHDSLSPAPSRLQPLGADFDGDTGSMTASMSKDANEEIEKYLNTREAWVTPSGRMRAGIDYDTAVLVIRNLTGRFDHVEQTPGNEIPRIA